MNSINELGMGIYKYPCITINIFDNDNIVYGFQLFEMMKSYNMSPDNIVCYYGKTLCIRRPIYIDDGYDLHHVPNGELSVVGLCNLIETHLQKYNEIYKNINKVYIIKGCDEHVIQIVKNLNK